MTEQEKRLTELVAGQARLEGSIETLNATVTAHMDKTQSEVKVLFASRRELAGKIHAIELDYVPDKDFKEHVTQNRDEHTETNKCLLAVKGKVAMASGAVAIVAFLAGLLVKSLGAWAQ